MFAFPSYGYNRPTPLYPSNRRPAQPLFGRSPYSSYYQHPEEEAYLRALAQERARRQAAERAAYSPFGFGFPAQEDDDEEAYVSRSRHGNNPRVARKQAEHERQLRERELMNAHLAEQRRREQLAAQARAQQQQEQQKRKTPSPVRTSPTPAQAPKPQQPTEKEVEAAQLIQATYRAHLLRKQATAQLEQIAQKLATLQEGFKMPEKLDFDESSPFPERMDESDDNEPSEMPVPKLQYNAHNTPVHAHEYALTQLLQELDGVESHGDPSIRGRRKALVGEVEAALKELEKEVRTLWEWQHLSSTTEEEEKPEGEGKAEEEEEDRELQKEQAATAMDVDVDIPTPTSTPKLRTSSAGTGGEAPTQPDTALSTDADAREEEGEADGWVDVDPHDLPQGDETEKEDADEQEVEDELPTAAPTPAPASTAVSPEPGETDTAAERDIEEPGEESVQTADEPLMEEGKQEVPVRIPSPERKEVNERMGNGEWRVFIQ